MRRKDVAVREQGGSLKRRDQTARGELWRGLLLKGLFALMVVVLCLSAERAYALRCGNRVVVMGTSTAEVFAKCGGPRRATFRG